MNEITDNEIIKALEFCASYGLLECNKCPKRNTNNTCMYALNKDALDLINRQNAQIEGLQDEVVIKTDMLNEQKEELEKLERIVFYGDAVIKKQEAEIERYLHSIKLLEKDVQTANAEIEELKIELQAMRGAANSYKAEVKRLKFRKCLYSGLYSEYDIKLIRDCTQGECFHRESEEAVRAEAIKEFAKRLKPILEEMFDLMIDDNEGKCIIEDCKKHSSVPCMNEYCIKENREAWLTKIDNLVKEMVGDDNG